LRLYLSSSKKYTLAAHGCRDSVKHYLFEKGLAVPPSSCDGEPAPDREAPAILPDDVIPGGKPNGVLKVALAVGSVGELLAVGEPERGCRTADGRYPRVGCSDLEDVIIDSSRLGQPCAFVGPLECDKRAVMTRQF
jgi:hypothetical protein